jgi:sulfate transport system ATP-binding protein
MKLVVEEVTKRFTLNGTPAVFGAGFEAVEGGVTTLLGPSGSGKTTLLRIIAGLESADEGRILVGGEDLTRVPVQRRGFGFVFQTFALFDQLTVRENIAFGLEAQGVPRQSVGPRVDELLALVQLDGLGHRYPQQLSGGQRQRVGFARALAPHPRLLLLDEPFGALDTRVRLELRALVRELHRATRLTTLLVTHDQEEALELSDRIVVMDRGRVLQVGSPRDIYDSPRTPFVASFLGSSNVFRGQIRDGRAAVGPVALAVPDHIPEGSAVRAVVRPHDVRISALGPTAEAPDGDGVLSSRSVGRILRIARLGPSVKLELTLTATGDVVSVQLSRREFEAMGVGDGDAVVIDLEQARIFVEDYAI